MEEKTTQNNVAKKKRVLSWGAYAFQWIWGLANKTYITLITIPLALLTGFFYGTVGQLIFLILLFFFLILFLFKGNEWAWKNQKWESEEVFNKIQKRWNIAGLVLFIFQAVIVLGITGALIFSVIKERKAEETFQSKPIETPVFYSWFPLGELRTKTADENPRMVTVGIRLGYDSEDKATGEEIQAREFEIRDFTRYFLSKKTAEMLRPANEADLLKEYVERVNEDILGEGEILVAVFWQLEVFE